MTIHGIGPLNFGIVGGLAPEGQLWLNYIPNGLLVKDPTTSSAQLTGTGNGTYRYNIDAGIIHVDSTIKEFPAAADQLLEPAGNIMANGYSKVYSVIAWRNPDTSAVALKVIPGTAALTGSQVAPSVADVEAALMPSAAWVLIANVTVNRTGDTTVTQSTDNTVRPSLVPQTVNRN